jgi:hypothetical protein
MHKLKFLTKQSKVCLIHRSWQNYWH